MMENTKLQLAELLNTSNLPSSVRESLKNLAFKLEAGTQTRDALLRTLKIRLGNKKERGEDVAFVNKIIHALEAGSNENVMINAVHTDDDSFVVYTDEHYTKIYGMV